MYKMRMNSCSLKKKKTNLLAYEAMISKLTSMEQKLLQADTFN